MTYNTYAQVTGADATGAATEATPAGADITEVIGETPLVETPPPEEQPITYGGKTICTFRGGDSTPIDKVKARNSYIYFQSGTGQVGFELFKDQSYEDVFTRSQVSSYLSNLGISTPDDIEIGRKYKGITDYSFLGLRSIVEGDDGQIEITAVSNYESELRRGLDDVTITDEEVTPSQAIFRIDSIDEENLTASGILKVRYKDTLGLVTNRSVEPKPGDDNTWALLRKVNTRAQTDSEVFDNGTIDVTCSFKNVPVNVFESGTAPPFDEDFDIDPEDTTRKFHRQRH
ncbi:MAG: hypothetical protein HYY52_08175 [Candidatus Melainabacteria bacterium]|nr:hypothetical protein [Candidatus Melainabacteria bacterium]